MDYDVVVVGAGPAGCLAAKYAAKNGAKTLIIEEHASIGRRSAEHERDPGV